MNGIDESHDPLQLIDYEKYLKCERCKETELYCYEHRIEVEKKLRELNSF